MGLAATYRGMAAGPQDISNKRELQPGNIVGITGRLVELRDRSTRFIQAMRNAGTMLEAGDAAA